MMKLYYAPGTCALAVHVALIWAETDYELIKVELNSEAFLQINPMGAVPAVQDGNSGIMTQADSLMNYIAAKFPEKNMAGDSNIHAKQQFDQWLAFLGGDLHPAFGPVFNPQRFTVKQDEESLASVKGAANVRLRSMYRILDKHLTDQDYIVNNRLTCVDPYAYVMTRWLPFSDVKIEEFPYVKRHFERLANEPGVIRAEKEQGLR